MILQSLAGLPPEVQCQLLDGVIHTFPENTKHPLRDIFLQVEDLEARTTFLNLLAACAQSLGTVDPEHRPYIPLFEILSLLISRAPAFAPRWLAFLRFGELVPIPPAVWDELNADLHRQIATESDHRTLLCLTQLQNMLFRIELDLAPLDGDPETVKSVPPPPRKSQTSSAPRTIRPPSALANSRSIGSSEIINRSISLSF